MGKKGLMAAIFSRLVAVDSSSPSSFPASPSWPWPSCRNNPQTDSFRAEVVDEDPCCTTARRRVPGPAATKLRGAGEMYKTVNSVYFDPASANHDFSSSLGDAEQREQEEVLDDDDDGGFSTTTASEEWSEAVIRSLGRSTSTDRFFFDPGPPASNSILAAASPAAGAPDPDNGIEDYGKQQQQQPCASTKSSLAEGSVAVALDSADPYGDFRASMEEMVAAHGLRDWAALEELLSWYLRINGKHNHPLIVGAFVDLLIGLASSPSSTAATTTTSSSSCGKSPNSSTTSATSITTTTATAAEMEQCGRGTEASCSSSASSCATPDAQDAVEDKASDPSDDDHIRQTGSTGARPLVR